MATRKKTAKAKTKVAAKKPAKKVVKLKAVKKPAAKAAKAANGNGLRAAEQQSHGVRPAGRSTACKILDFTHVQSGPTCTQLLA